MSVKNVQNSMCHFSSSELYNNYILLREFDLSFCYSQFNPHIIPVSEL